MKWPRLVAVSVVAAIVGTVPARADVASTMQRYVGYTIGASKSIKGWVSPDRTKKGDDFHGCEYGRYIVFDDDTYLKCSSYGYQYAYHPTAILLVRSGQIVMLVDGDAYDMTT
jgi:hypothetical protein